MNRLLITGDTGFIGSYLKKRLTSDYEVEGVSRRDGIDITDMESLERLQSVPDVIIHGAALATDDYEAAYEANVTGTLNICRYAKIRGVKKMVLLSTIFAADHPENGYYNSYGQTKRIAEEVAEAYCKAHRIELTVLRLAQVYDDARLAQKGQAMLYYFVDTISKEGKISLFGRSNPLRNYIHIEYLCSVIEEIILSDVRGLWYVTEEKSHTIAEIAYMLFGLYRQYPDITWLTEKPDIPTVYIPQKQRYQSDNIPSIPLEEGLQRIINYER